MSYDFAKIGDAALSRPKNLAYGNFAKFENPGDMVEGYIRDVFYIPKKGMFKPARGLTLEQKDGTLVNVQIKRWPSNLEVTDKLRLGDPIRVLFKETKKSNYPQPMKIFQFFGTNLPETEGQKTVAELDAMDMASQKVEIEEGDKALDAMAADLTAKTS